eukprot:4870715-Alexandrium_andersonii.AAC.1
MLVSESQWRTLPLPPAARLLSREVRLAVQNAPAARAAPAVPDVFAAPVAQCGGGGGDHDQDAPADFDEDVEYMFAPAHFRNLAETLRG